jgi:hypothetical protein
VDRALTDPDAARAHLALAGALDPAREAGGDTDDPLAATAVAVFAVRALDRLEEPHPPAPSLAPTRPQLVREGALVAHRRFGVALDRLARLADLPVTELRDAVE